MSIRLRKGFSVEQVGAVLRQLHVDMRIVQQFHVLVGEPVYYLLLQNTFCSDSKSIRIMTYPKLDQVQLVGQEQLAKHRHLGVGLQEC